MDETVFPLLPFPASPPDGVTALSVAVGALADGGLRLRFDLHGDPALIRWPQTDMGRQGEALWEHTCFETFVAVEGEDAYREFNFSPSGQWADYVFSTYRERATADMSELPPPVFCFERQDEGARLEAEIPSARLPERANGRVLRLGLSAVIESQGGGLFYRALKHPVGKPDFHHRGAFAVRLNWQPKSFSPSAGTP